MARRLQLNSRMGLTVDRRRDQPAGARLRRPGRGARRLQRVQPARLADDVVEPPRPAATIERTHPLGHVVTGYEPSLPFDDPRHLAAHRFLVEEAAILDAGDWAAWLACSTDDVRYVMPVRVTTVADAGFDAPRRHGPLRRGPLRASRSGSSACSPTTPGPRTRRRAPATS